VGVGVRERKREGLKERERKKKKRVRVGQSAAEKLGDRELLSALFLRCFLVY
jgi:hypothetical protein